MNFKKIRPILAVSLFVQSITFLVLSLVNAEKKKNLAIVFGVFSAIGGIAGIALTVSEVKDRKRAKLAAMEEDEYFDEILDEFDDLHIGEDEITCSFEEPADEIDA